MMHRIITIDATEYTASIGALENYRVAIVNGEISVSPDLDARTSDADFEAVFYGKQRVEVITFPAPETEEVVAEVPNPEYIDADTTPDVPETIEETQTVTGPERYTIGPLALDEGETPLVLAKRKKLAEIAAARYAVEIGGVVVDNMAIMTDRESQALITGAAFAATQDSNFTCQWKTSGGFVTLDATTILAAAQAVRSHVQGCFDREAELTAAVEAAMTVAAVEAVTW
jgi:hypothetical protein